MLYFFGGTIPPAVIKTEKRSKGSPGGSGVPLRFPAITAIHVFTKLIRYRELSWPKQ